MPQAPDPGAQLSAVIQRTYIFEHETGGMQPLTEGAELVNDAARRLADKHASLQRVVNISLFDTRVRRMQPREPLLSGGSYRLSVQIGAPLAVSLVEAPQPVDEDALRQATDGHIKLRVVAFSTDVAFEVSEAIVLLPPAPKGSKPVFSRFHAPQKSGTARLRVAVYRERNLLQTLLVEAMVAESRSLRPAPALTAKVDFTHG